MAKIPPYIRIVCEGLATEPNYFNGWLKANGYVAPNITRLKLRKK